MASSRKDPEFGDKLDHLEGVLGALLPAACFRKSYQADHLETLATQFSRKRKGDEAVSNRDLSKLIDLFQLGDRFDFELFRLSFSGFRDALKQKGVGTYGTTLANKHRQYLFSKANNDHPVVIRRTMQQRAGGIGGEPLSMDMPQFRISDQVYLSVATPGDGYLFVLNDGTAQNELTCLMPSEFAPNPYVKGPSVRIPTTEIERPFFTISGPTGFYRIYAIWTAEPLSNILPNFNDLSFGVSKFPPDLLERLYKHLKVSENRTGSYRVTMADYRVS